MDLKWTVARKNTLSWRHGGKVPKEIPFLIFIYKNIFIKIKLFSDLTVRAEIRTRGGGECGASQTLENLRNNDFLLTEARHGSDDEGDDGTLQVHQSDRGNLNINRGR